MDKATEAIARAIYEDMKKTDAGVDWFWVKHEVESLLAGKSVSGSVGQVVCDHLKKAGKLYPKSTPGFRDSTGLILLVYFKNFLKFHKVVLC